MDEKQDAPDSEEPYQFPSDELEAVRGEFHAHTQRAYLMYAIRWTIGLALTWLITSYWPHLHWLWWVALIAAGLSLLFLLAADYTIRRKVARSEARMTELRESIREYVDRDSDVR